MSFQMFLWVFLIGLFSYSWVFRVLIYMFWKQILDLWLYFHSLKSVFEKLNFYCDDIHIYQFFYGSRFWCCILKKKLSHCHVVLLISSRSFIVLSFTFISKSTEKDFLPKRKEALCQLTVCTPGKCSLLYKTKVCSKRMKRKFVFYGKSSRPGSHSDLLVQMRDANSVSSDCLKLVEFWWFGTDHSVLIDSGSIHRNRQLWKSQSLVSMAFFPEHSVCV